MFVSLIVTGNVLPLEALPARHHWRFVFLWYTRQDRLKLFESVISQDLRPVSGKFHSQVPNRLMI